MASLLCVRIGDCEKDRFVHVSWSDQETKGGVSEKHRFSLGQSRQGRLRNSGVSKLRLRRSTRARMQPSIFHRRHKCLQLRLTEQTLCTKARATSIHLHMTFIASFVSLSTLPSNPKARSTEYLRTLCSTLGPMLDPMSSTGCSNPDAQVSQKSGRFERSKVASVR